MSARPVDPVNGKYTIRGKDNRNLELTLDDSDLRKYIVEELDDDDLNSKLPSSNPLHINWFTGFSIYKKKNGMRDGYAKVKYAFTTRLDEGQRLFVAYGGQAFEVTDEIKKNGKVTLSEGDPGAGTVP